MKCSKPQLCIVALLTLLSASQSQPQSDGQPAASTQPARPTVSFSFDRKGLPIPAYRLAIAEDGAASYSGTEEAANSPLAAQPFNQRIALSTATTRRVFQLARKLKHFNLACNSKLKNLADTGTKTLAYAGPEASGSCIYNYTENKDVQTLTEIVQGIAETLDEGRLLDHLHRYDRLGLDAAITYFAAEVSAGHALELGTIAPSLRSLAADPDVMERVRTRANTLLARIPPDNTAR